LPTWSSGVVCAYNPSFVEIPSSIADFFTFEVSALINSNSVFKHNQF